jgi:hypothetical protein
MLFEKAMSFCFWRLWLKFMSEEIQKSHVIGFSSVFRSLQPMDVLHFFFMQELYIFYATAKRLQLILLS